MLQSLFPLVCCTKRRRPCSCEVDTLLFLPSGFWHEFLVRSKLPEVNTFEGRFCNAMGGASVCGTTLLLLQKMQVWGLHSGSCKLCSPSGVNCRGMMRWQPEQTCQELNSHHSWASAAKRLLAALGNGSWFDTSAPRWCRSCGRCMLCKGHVLGRAKGRSTLKELVQD